MDFQQESLQLFVDLLVGLQLGLVEAEEVV